MTLSAWLMLSTTFSVVAFFTVRFFLKVLRTPPREDTGGDAENVGAFAQPE